MATETWLGRWAMVEFRVQDCQAAWSAPNVLTSGLMEAKATLEAAAQEFWALRDWLKFSPTSPITLQQASDFESSPNAYHLRACADLATWVKHAAVDHEIRHLLALEYSGEVIDGYPIPYRAVRTYYQPRSKEDQKARSPRASSQNVDNYPDASEMVRRAYKELREFLAPYLPPVDEP